MHVDNWWKLFLADEESLERYFHISDLEAWIERDLFSKPNKDKLDGFDDWPLLRYQKWARTRTRGNGPNQPDARFVLQRNTQVKCSRRVNRILLRKEGASTQN